MRIILISLMCIPTALMAATRVDFYDEALRIFGTAEADGDITRNRALQGNRIHYLKNGNIYPDEREVKYFDLDYTDKKAGDFSVRFSAESPDPVGELGFMPGPYQKTWKLSEAWNLKLWLKGLDSVDDEPWTFSFLDDSGNRASGRLTGFSVNGEWHSLVLPLGDLRHNGEFDFENITSFQMENRLGPDGELWFDDVRFTNPSGGVIGVTDKSVSQRQEEAAGSRMARVAEAFRKLTTHTPETLKLNDRHVYWRDYLNPHFAKLWLGEDLEAVNADLLRIFAATDPEVRKMYELDGKWSLYLTPTLIQLYYTFGSKAKRMPGRLEPETENALLELLWERTKIKNDIAIARQSTWWMAGSENHDINANMANLLSSQIFMNEPAYADRIYPDLGYGSGYGYGNPGLARKTGGRANLKDGREYNARDHYEACVRYWIEWFEERSQRGLFIEVNSRTYQLYSLGFLQCILDLCEDPVVRSKARKFFDLVWLDWSQDQIGGMWGGARTRNGLPNSSYCGMTQFSKFLFGGPGDAAHGFFHLLLSDYELPAIVWEMAMDREGLGCFAYISRRPGEEENLWPRPLGNERTLLCDTESRLLRYSWVTPDYIMGTQMDHPGAVHSHLSISRRHHSIIFAGDPWCRVMSGPLHSGEGGRFIGTSTFDQSDPDSWRMGADHAYRSVQSRSVLITQQARNLTRVSPEWFPDYTMENKPYGIFFDGEFDRFEEKDGWIFLAKGNAYFAVRVVVSSLDDAYAVVRPRGVQEPPLGKDGYDWNSDRSILRLKGNYSPIIFEAGRKADYATLEAFQEDVLDNPLHLYSNLGPSELGFFTLIYTGCGEDAEEIVFNAANSEIPTVGGEYIDYAPPKLFDSPYLESDYKSGAIKASKGTSRLNLNFND
ncbi:MAG: hypothetical protein AB3N64_13420 [Puniceicoccaceae bacterium]